MSRFFVYASFNVNWVKCCYLTILIKGDVEMMQEINKLSRVIELLRKQLNKDLPSQHIALLLAVAQEPGITMPELCKRLDMPQGTVSRNVKLMSHYADKNGDAAKKGYGLLETEPATSNRYQLAVSLTAEGERLIQKLVKAMEDARMVENIREQVVEASLLQRRQAVS